MGANSDAEEVEEDEEEEEEETGDRRRFLGNAQGV